MCNVEGNEDISSAKDLDLDALRTRLTEEDSFIFNLIDKIPPQFYFDDEIKEEIIAEKHAAMDEKAEDIKKGLPRKLKLTSKIKHKRARLDIQQHKSVSQIQQKLEEDKHVPKSQKKDYIPPSTILSRAANIQELQKRLQERIKELEEKRRGCTKEEFLKKKQLNRKMSKLRKKQKGNLNKPVFNGQINQGTVSKSPVSVDVKPNPIYNKEGKIVYSKFEFSEPGETPFKKKKRNKKNLKKLIETAEMKKEKIETVKQTDPNKANELQQKNAWHRAIQKAEGVKLKDDPALLKKSLKKQEKLKKKSAKEWKNRTDRTEKLQKIRQEKRTKNIQAKKREKLDKKIKRAKKKGRIIPGF